MFISSILTNEFHQMKGLDVAQSFIKTFTYRLGSSIFSLKTSIYAFITVLLDLPKYVCECYKYSAIIREFKRIFHNDEKEITPYIFIGYYGHTYLHSLKGINEKIDESSMKGIIDNIRMEEVMTLFRGVMIKLVSCIMILVYFNMYGGSISWFSSLIYIFLFECCSLMNGLLSDFCCTVLYDSLEQLSEGNIIPRFTGLIQILNTSNQDDGYNKVI